MADINNFSEITENFDTIKTLLNSIRAQGILNTSDVDKLLAGINSKLEKINTEEDIDLIKIFLSELKQNLDERHNVLLSKFGAIESLFSNLLKNSSETIKSSEIKELFDIVATNLSVFSREVVSQKESLSDIVLRLDSMRSDDSQKKEIVKNISLLKNDLERLSNGFDSIVLNINENFKSVLKSISGIDPSENINKFGNEIEDILNSSKTVLSAIQMLDKKNETIEDTLAELATKEDVIGAKKWISDLAAQEHELSESIGSLSDRFYKVDNLAEKIDASVNIIAGLKTLISETDEKSAQVVLDKLSELETKVKQITESKQFDEFKANFEESLRSIFDAFENFNNSIKGSFTVIQQINSAIASLDINANFKSLVSDLTKSEHNVREHVTLETGKIVQLVDVNTTRTINEITANADSLSNKITQTQNVISTLCEKSFTEVEENITTLKNVVSQIDENNVSANNAIFSNITDRLALFENNLKSSLEKQEEYVANSSSTLIEQINNIKELSGVLDYKMDSSVIEINNAKTLFKDLKSAVEGVLALDFTTNVKDLKVDLYAAKQELNEALESISGELSENVSNDLLGKYELLISKLDNVETEIKLAQASSLSGMKGILESISSSIVDVLSYVSNPVKLDTEKIDTKLEFITKTMSDNNLNFVENVRDIVEVIKTQVDNNLKSIHEDTVKTVNSVSSSIVANSNAIRSDIESSYNKLLEVKEVLEKNNTNLSDGIDNVLETAGTLRNDFETKLSTLKTALLDKVSDFQNEFICSNADKINELKFTSETLNTKSIQNANSIKEELQGEIAKLIGSLKLNIEELSELIAGSTLKMESSNHEILDYIRNDFNAKLNNSLDELDSKIDDFSQSSEDRVRDIVSNFQNLSKSVEDLSTNTTSSLSSTLAKILENFVSIKAFLSSLNEKSSEDLKTNVKVITDDFKNLIKRVEIVDENIDEDFSRQLSLIESNFENLTNCLTELTLKNSESLSSSLESGLSEIKSSVAEAVVDNLNNYKGQIEDLFNTIASNNNDQSAFISEKVIEMNSTLRETMKIQEEQTLSNIKELISDFKQILDENVKLTAADYASLKSKLDSFNKDIIDNNLAAAKDLKAQLDDIAQLIDSNFDSQRNDINEKLTEISTSVTNSIEELTASNTNITERASKNLEEIKELFRIMKENIRNAFNDNSTLLISKLDDYIANVSDSNKILLSVSQSSNDTINAVKESVDIVSEKCNEIPLTIKKLTVEQTTSIIENIRGVGARCDEIADAILSLSEEKTDAVLGSVSDLFAKYDETTNSLQISSEEKANAILNSVQDLAQKCNEIEDSVRKESADNTASILENLRDLSAKCDDITTAFMDSSEANTEALLDNIKILTELCDNLTNKFALDSETTQSLVKELSSKCNEISSTFANASDKNVETIVNRVNSLSQKCDEILNIVINTSSENSETVMSKINSLCSQAEDLKAELHLLSDNNVKALNEKFAELSEVSDNIYTTIVNLNSDTRDIINKKIDDNLLTIVNNLKSEIAVISDALIKNSKDVMNDVEQSIEEKVNSLLVSNADIAASELQSMESFADNIMNEVLACNNTVEACKDFTIKFLQNELNILNSNIEKETDVIVKDLLEQIASVQEVQKDEFSKMTIHIESTVEDHIYNHISELKSYLDIKTDSTVLNSKLDNLGAELDKSAEDILEAANKLLEKSVFENAVSDVKSTMNILISSMTESFNKQLNDLITNNVSKNIDEKFIFFDKKFTDVVVDKYEEVKLISTRYNEAFASIESSVQELVSVFVSAKNDINASLTGLVENINNNIDKLALSFIDLKAQILNKSFDEAFQASVNNQISSLENLVNEQFGYLEEINELCSSNLPELTEMNAIVKYNIAQSISDLNEKVESQQVSVEQGLNNLKTDVITQFLNIFNQISFVAEQEEILDFIQEKHSELITILSHIVTTIDDVENIKDNLAIVDNKVDTLKEDIDLINEKITAIMSSDGDIDYVYSLQDLESDIANLRLVLNEVKENNSSKELSELINSTNNIYSLVETIKNELPNLNTDEFRKDFEALSEDIVSISTRTNKLILASDESYKTLQENLQDFKLVINDLDERTRNFAHESGLDRIDNKLGAINTMIVNGAKTNQVFNQVFEYLAEWVDNAGAQITAISDKVETLDDIGQIKVMLEDLKAESEDNSESAELIEALGTIFEKQAKKISSLEAKLDRIIVETTINNKNNKIDLTPMEETLNRFLVAIDDKMTSQQSRIKSLEEKLEDMSSMLNTDDTAQLTKKVGGMDRQIAKLNKSIEKIASHVIEK